MKATEASIQHILGKHYGIKRGYITIPNILLIDKGMYEADFIYINKNKYLFEVEIKISITDFKADFNKKIYHSNSKVRALYYAIPRELYYKHENAILDMTRSVGAGIIVCGERFCEVAEKPKIRKVEPLNDKELLEYARIGCLKWIRKWGETNECRG